MQLLHVRSPAAEPQGKLVREDPSSQELGPLAIPGAVHLWRETRAFELPRALPQLFGITDVVGTCILLIHPALFARQWARWQARTKSGRVAALITQPVDEYTSSW